MTKRLGVRRRAVPASTVFLIATQRCRVACTHVELFINRTFLQPPRPRLLSFLISFGVCGGSPLTPESTMPGARRADFPKRTSMSFSPACQRLPSTCVFYDVETSGLSPMFDQILQVAALKTDASLTLDPRKTRTFDMSCRPMPHIVPSPAAMLKTRVTGEDLQRRPYSLQDTMHDFEQVTTAWGSSLLFLGYNNMHFDEAFLRQGLYQSIRPPYLTQTRGSSRADVMIMMQAASVLAPDAIEIPTDPATGRRTFRLGDVCRANGVPLLEEEAHDALADVKATVRLAALLKHRAPAVFAMTLALADKRHVLRLVRHNPVLVTLRVVHGVPCVRAVVPLGPAPHNPNSIMCVDLSVDPGDYLELRSGDLQAWMRHRSSPLTTIRANAQPLVFAADEDFPGRDRLGMALGRTMERRREGASSVRLADLLERADRVQSDLGFQARVKNALAVEQEARSAPEHVEQMIYDGFASWEDYAHGLEIHRAMSFARADHIGALEDTRLAELARRWVHGEAPETLDMGTRRRLDEWRRERVLGPVTALWRSVERARLELVELASTSSAEDGRKLTDLDRYLERVEGAVRSDV